MNQTNSTKFPHFETQSLDEEVIVFERAHFFTNVGWTILVVVLILVPPALKLIPFGNNSPINISLSQTTQFVLTLSWYLFVVAYAFQRFLLWFFNVYIVTTKRVVDIDFFNLFYKQISSTTLDDIQDVTHTRGGVAQLIFDYGNVFIQTAGTITNFEFDSIAKPNEIQKKVINLLTKKGPSHFKGKI
ncbi:MAG: hypothetical protein WD231_05480 [Candidatus Woykebacteria bacterium]